MTARGRNVGRAPAGGRGGAGGGGGGAGEGLAAEGVEPAATGVGVPPRNCIAFEDAEAGIEAIKAAKMLGLNRNTLRKKIRELDIRVIRGLK